MLRFIGNVLNLERSAPQIVDSRAPSFFELYQLGLSLMTFEHQWVRTSDFTVAAPANQASQCRQ